MVEVWNTRLTDWKEFSVDQRIPAGDYDTVLVRTPYVEGLVYLGIEIQALGSRTAPLSGLHSLANERHATQEYMVPRARDDLLAHLHGLAGATSIMHIL